MTDTNPPADRIDEADAAIRAIATTKYHPAPWTSEYDSFGTDINLGPYFQVSDASGHFVAVTESEEVHTLLLNAADDINRLSARVEELEGQLGKARGGSRLAEARAAGWDEGYGVGRDDEAAAAPVGANPYRSRGTETVIGPDTLCPCGKVNDGTGSGYCSGEHFDKYDGWSL